MLTGAQEKNLCIVPPPLHIQFIGVFCRSYGNRTPSQYIEKKEKIGLAGSNTRDPSAYRSEDASKNCTSQR